MPAMHNVVTVLLECFINVLTLAQHGSDIVRMFCVLWECGYSKKLAQLAQNVLAMLLDVTVCYWCVTV